ncbi:hypothetical protein [Solwaraspora sp. WMMA2065]|uniref:hypothetical protein n=1 Tax=Solwaraspora sp. WMMA2065 TaxID=3015166 RepID=UPI00259BD895|nr:hypothetical protein [Solwaraspora sp. WMMA2065]WJK34749.1 hypothetical protein O7610_29970 [Solwaraspora sp. WMMA2065]
MNQRSGGCRLWRYFGRWVIGLLTEPVLVAAGRYGYGECRMVYGRRGAVGGNLFGVRLRGFCPVSWPGRRYLFQLRQCPYRGLLDGRSRDGKAFSATLRHARPGAESYDPRPGRGTTRPGSH